MKKKQPLIRINVNTAVEGLRKMSIGWGGKFTEGFGTARLDLDNQVGKGCISSYDILPGLSVNTYNVRFKKEVRFSKNEEQMNPLYFLYCLKGYFYHRFGDDGEMKKVSEMQSVVLTSSIDQTNDVVLPANTDLQISVIILMTERLKDAQVGSRHFLQKTLQQTFSFVDSQTSFKHYGEINPKTSEFAKILIENKRTGVVGRLLTEASVLNTLASQLENLKVAKLKQSQNKLVDDSTLRKVIGLSAYISDNISQRLSVNELAMESGLSPKKLQRAMKYLYGCSVNECIRNVKLEYAKDLIQSTNLSISEITYEVGFSSRSYFSRIFNERFGIQPYHFKESFKKDNVLFELSYRSLMSPEVNSEVISDIVSVSRRQNKIHNITGCLVYHNNMFFQLLEGPKDAVLQLYENIKEDQRHYEVKTLWQGAKLKRIFEDWNLALVSQKGNFKVKVDGVLRHVNLDDIMKENEDLSISSDLLWRRVRNILKTA
ncbi:BLUF domain-containing protein [Winogradskyella maritima]|uniref:BLUF domain-containing protein n=1 Tax=Winogradskyella maritima TaxID=1517766 RepID=A0ABV8AH17_9FLAO|nr:BLUF domain-containing protein [Winogradskyella maritima]